MEKIFYISPHISDRRHDIFVQSQITAKYGDKSLRALVQPEKCKCKPCSV